MGNRPLRIGINGFGRIGRNVLRAYMEYEKDHNDVKIVAINDVADAKTLLHLLKYDSTHGRLSDKGIEVDVCDNTLFLHKNQQTTRISLLNKDSPKQLNWGGVGVDVVLECTGQFRAYDDALLHQKAGAKQVIVGAAPFDRVDASVVVGVNDDKLSKDIPIISSVSCTTQALVPLLYVLDSTFGVESAMLTEIHAVTADQTVLDKAHRDLRRARASGHNIIATTSSSIAASIRVLPQLAGKLNGYSVRVPTINVALIDVSVLLKTDVLADELCSVFQRASFGDSFGGRLKGILGYTDEPLVSSDFIHNRHSLVVDAGQLMQAGRQIKCVAWYDNEWGYANRLLDICQKLAKS